MTRATVADAIARADQAINRVETHEEVCAVRYETIAAGQRAQERALGEFKASVEASMAEQRKDNKWLMRWIIATLLTALGSAIGVIVVLATHGR